MKGLEALHHPRIKSAQVDIGAEGKRGIAYMFFDDTKQYAAIEKALEQAEENEKVLDIFKNALTIEHQPISVEPLDDKNFVGSLVRSISTIRTNELDKSLRETLRKWVLKNAFLKELKALEIIIEKEVNIQNFKICLSAKWEYELFEENCSDNDEYNEMPPYKHSMTKEQFDLLREVLQ